MGFSLIWQIWWLAILGSLAVAVVVLIAGWGTEREQEVSAAELAQMERARGSEQPA
jgi:cytochrome o ubiquinol oxidase subunit 1